MATLTRNFHTGGLVRMTMIFSFSALFSTFCCVPFTLCSAKEVAPQTETIEGHLDKLQKVGRNRALKKGGSKPNITSKPTSKPKKGKQPLKTKEPKKGKKPLKPKKSKKPLKPLVCNVKGPIINCALYHEDDEDKCVACAEHYELNNKGKCSPCVTCSGPWGTLDFCPIFSAVWGGTVPIDPETGEMPLFPKDSTSACNEYVSWGYDGYASEDIPAYYCKPQLFHRMIWVYNITVTQKKSDMIDGVEREVIMSRSGDDEDYRVPTRPVYACERDTIIARTHNNLPDHVHGDAWPPEGENFDTMTMGISLHWHGMWQKNNQFMDGVSMVTQCPIGNLRNNEIPCTSQRNDPNGNRFDYTMRANPDGTYWFHSHTGLQYGDGLFGPLIIFDRPRHNPYSDLYDHEIEAIMMGDWWHRLSQDLAVDLFYGSNDDDDMSVADDGPATGQRCKVNNVRCKKAFNPDNWESTFQCLCAGGSSDFPYVSGHLNGKGTYPEITMTTPISLVKRANFNEVKFTADKSYRLRIINAGFNFGLRFSIDDHTFTVIAADGGYIESISDVSHFASMAGERYDIIVKAKTKNELQQLGGKQFFMRATTYNDTSWKFDESLNAQVIVDDGTKHTIYGVVNYQQKMEAFSDEEKKKKWFKKNTKLRKDVHMPAPLVTKVVDISMYYSLTDYQDEMSVIADSSTVIDSLRDFRYPVGTEILGCNAPVHSGKGKTGAPFGCNTDGTPINKIPDPDLLVHLWVNGIMFPAYNLFLAKSEVLDYKNHTSSDDMWQKGIDGIGFPNMFARPSEPLLFTRGKYGTRNLDTYGASEDSPGYDNKKSPPLGDFGSFMQKNYGTTGFTENTNKTNLIYLPKDKWVQVWVHDGGPMTHPFHLHGYDTWLLGRNRKTCPAGSDPKICGRTRTTPCSDNSDDVPDNRFPIMFEREKANPNCKKAMSNYLNGFGASTIPPVHGRYQPKTNLDTIEALNTENPPRRDMTLVPPHGYVAFQFFTDNPGSWFYHCHLEFHAGLGMAVVWMVGTEGEDFLNEDATTQQIGARNQGNCGDVEFEGPIQFY